MKQLSDFRTLMEADSKPKPKPKPASTKTGAKKPEKPSLDNLSILKNIIVKQKKDTLVFSDGTEIDIEPPEANAIVSMYSRLTKENKNKVQVLLTKGVSTVMRLTKFAMSQ